MKTIINTLAVVLCLLFYSSATAQVGGGIEGAITTSSVKITDIPNQFTNTLKGDGLAGFEGGFFIIVGAGPLYVKPKLLFDYQGGTLSYTPNEAGATSQAVDFKAGKLLIPVLAGFRIIPPVLSIEGGPVYNHLLYATKDFDGNQINLAKGGFGYRIGLNASITMLNLSVSYQGIKNSGSVTSSASYQCPDMLIFGAGIQF